MTLVTDRSHSSLPVIVPLRNQSLYHQSAANIHVRHSFLSKSELESDLNSPAYQSRMENSPKDN